MKLICIAFLILTLSTSIWAQDDPSFAPVNSSSLYRISASYNLKTLEASEGFNSMLQDMQEMPNAKEYLINQFQINLSVIIKLQWFQDNLIWSEEREPNKETKWILDLSPQELEKIKLYNGKDSPIEFKIDELTLIEALSCETPVLSKDKLEDLKKENREDVQEWIGLRFNEAVELAKKQNVHLLLFGIDSTAFRTKGHGPTLPLYDGNEKAQFTVRVSVEGGYITNAIKYNHNKPNKNDGRRER